jgi:hypothetical protein
MPFVIIASARTGSTHLTTLLHKRSDIVCHGELFHPKMKSFLGRWRPTEVTPESKEQLAALRAHDPNAFLERIFANGFKGGPVGFKIFRGHNDDILDQLIADRDVRKIVLFRGNMLAVYSSSRIAHSVGGERVLRTARAVQPVVPFEARKFVKFCRRYSAFYRDVVGKLNASGQPYYFLHYEDINDSSLFAGLLNFIDANCVEVTLESVSIKQNSSEVLKRFSNPDEAENFLREHGLMAWAFEAAGGLNPFPDDQSADDTAMNGVVELSSAE